MSEQTEDDAEAPLAEAITLESGSSHGATAVNEGTEELSATARNLQAFFEEFRSGTTHSSRADISAESAWAVPAIP